MDEVEGDIVASHTFLFEVSIGPLKLTIYAGYSFGFSGSGSGSGSGSDPNIILFISESDGNEILSTNSCAVGTSIEDTNLEGRYMKNVTGLIIVSV